MQNIVLKLVYQGKPFPPNAGDIAPWLDLRVPPIEVQAPLLAAITDRRQLKTHLRLDALEFNPKAKYIYLGRDGRDCFMSLVNHYRKGNDLWYHVLESPGMVGEPLPHFDEALHCEEKLFDQWISRGGSGTGLNDETDGYPFWSLFDNVRTWWEFRHLPNIKFVHYADLLKNLDKEVRGIAAFLDISIDEENFPALVHSLSFETMKAECTDSAERSSKAAPLRSSIR